MTAEPIARVVADLHARRVRLVTSRQVEAGFGKEATDAVAKTALDSAADDSYLGPAKVIDASAIYRQLTARPGTVAIYEDHPCIAPAFPHMAVCYCNEHGNVIAMDARSFDRGRTHPDDWTDLTASMKGSAARARQEPNWTPAEPIDWAQVRWTIDTTLWLGGRNAEGEPMTTSGPIHMWRFAVYDDGRPADLHWVHLIPEWPKERWDTAHLVLLGALNFMACVNVQVVEPARDRPTRRRLARTGVTVHELTIVPISKSRRAGQAAVSGAGVPLTDVRGHFASYGPEHGRGLLFGKYAGRFWIPAHARGSKDVGEADSSYRLDPAG